MRSAARAGLTAAAVLAASGAAWAAASQPSTDTVVDSGVVSDDGGRPMFAAAFMHPGQSQERCISVTQIGASSSRSPVFLRGAGRDQGALAGALRLRVESGTLPVGEPFPSCERFAPAQTLYDGPLTGYPSATGELADAAGLADVGETRSYRFTVTLPAGADHVHGVAWRTFSFDRPDTAAAATPTPSPAPSPPSPSPTPSPSPSPVATRTATPSPTPAGAQQILTCAGGELTLIDVTPLAHGRVALLGVTKVANAGRTVALRSLAQRKVVARPRVRADGTFSATVPGPPARVAATNRARYRAESGGIRSAALKLHRRMTVTHLAATGRRIGFVGTLSGRVPAGARVELRLYSSCTAFKVVASAKPRHGGYAVHFLAPKGSQALVLRATLRASAGRHTTFTVFRPVETE